MILPPFSRTFIYEPGFFYAFGNTPPIDYCDSIPLLLDSKPRKICSEMGIPEIFFTRFGNTSIKRRTTIAFESTPPCPFL